MNKKYQKSFPQEKNAAKRRFGGFIYDVIPDECNWGSSPYKKTKRQGYHNPAGRQTFGYDSIFINNGKIEDPGLRPSSMTYSRAGFTLMELLVVVLIIGVLAAVALPQYETAVMASRVMAFMPAARAIKDAQERYYMNNGDYTLDLRDLDIAIPPGCKLFTGSSVLNQVLCGEDWVMDNLGSGGAEPYAVRQLELHYCPGGHNKLGTASCNNNTDKGRITLYYDQHRTLPGRIGCTSESKRFCAAMRSVLK